METKQMTTKSNHNQKSKPNAAKLPWTGEERRHITDALNHLLADYSVHYQKLRNYHWNVKGSDFFDLHQEFEAQYNEARQHIDEIAERIRVFGQTPMSTMKEYLETSKIKETGTDLSSGEMVQEILKDYRILDWHISKALEVAGEQEDSGTEEMLKRFTRMLEKHHWMLSAFSAES